jgi:ubiquinone/menaquinone biosynthesis C-methylase UbiE
MPGYDYASADDLAHADGTVDAVRKTVFNYFNDQLGWPPDKCERRVKKELGREIPKGLFNVLEHRRDWDLRDAKLLDVGAGQGGAVVEALLREADAYGVEPGPEFARLARMRIDDAGFDANRLYETGGESLPFPDNHFDYAISLQVLEHVEDPRPLLEEMYRVLKPGGEAAIRCENYLAFREQHYRVPWLPLLPKSLGSAYLRLLGRDPSFLQNYVFYSTYPQILRLTQEVGFTNITNERRLEKARTLEGFQTYSSALLGRALGLLPKNSRVAIAQLATHTKETFSVGIRLNLLKPPHT